MKQTRNAITFLQAQYRALLQRTLWARFASVLSYGAAAGVSAPLLGSTVVAATDQVEVDATVMDAVAVIDPVAITYGFIDGNYDICPHDSRDSKPIVDSYAREGKATPQLVTAVSARADISRNRTAVHTKSQDERSVSPRHYHEQWWSEGDGLSAVKFGSDRESLLTLNHPLSAKPIDELQVAYEHLNYELAAGSLSAGASVSVPVSLSSWTPVPLEHGAIAADSSSFSSSSLVTTTSSLASPADVSVTTANIVSEGRALPTDKTTVGANSDVLVVGDSSSSSSPVASPVQQASLSLENIGQQAIHIAALPERDISSVQLATPLLGAFTANSVTPTSLESNAESRRAFPFVLADQQALAATRQQVVPQVPYAPKLVTHGQDENTRSVVAKPRIASVFVPPAVSTPRYVARTTSQGQVQVKSADGTQLSFVPHSPSTQAVKVSLQEPSVGSSSVNDDTETSDAVESHEATRAVAEPWLQVSLAEGQSYDLMVETDEDWYALVNGLEGLNGVELDPESSELVFDLSGLGGEQPYTLRIDGSIVEGQQSAVAKNAHEGVNAGGNGRLDSLDSSASTSLHGGLLVSMPEYAMWDHFPELANNEQALAPTASGSTLSSAASSLPTLDASGHKANARLDLQHVLYAPNFAGTALGQMQMEVPLYLGEHTTLLLKDNLALTPQVTESWHEANAQQAASLNTGLLQPYAAIKSGRSSVFAPLNENLQENPLTIKLDVAQSTAASHFDERVLATTPHHGAGAVNVGANRSDEIALTFYAAPEASTHSTNRTTTAYGTGRAATTPVRFIVGQDTDLELDMSALEHGTVAIASSPAMPKTEAHEQAHTESAVVVQRDLGSHLLHVSGADLALAKATPQGNKVGESTANSTGATGATSTTGTLDYLHATTSLQNVVSLHDSALDSSALADQGQLTAVRFDFAPVASEHLNAVSWAMEQNSSRAGNAVDVTSNVNVGNAGNEGSLVPELSGNFASSSLHLPQTYQWVEVPAQQTLALYSTPLAVVDYDESLGSESFTSPLFLPTENKVSAGVQLQPESQLHLFGSGSIGPLTGLGKVYLQDASVQVRSRQGTPADVTVKEISLERSHLQGREVRATHFNLQDSSIQAQALIVKGNSYPSPVASAGILSVGSVGSVGVATTAPANANAVQGNEFKSGKTGMESVLPRESSKACESLEGRLPAVDGDIPAVPMVEVEGSQGLQIEQGGATGSDANSGSNSSLLQDAGLGSNGDISAGSFSALNSDVHVPYIDLRAASSAQMQGGSLQALELQAHRLSLRDGVSAFVQHIELQGLDSELSLGSVVATDERAQQSATVKKAKVKAQSGSATTVRSKAGAKVNGSNVLKQSPLSRVPSQSVQSVQSVQAMPSVPSQLPNYSMFAGMELDESLSELTVAAEQLEQLKWQDPSVMHTSLLAQSVDLHGGLLQLYGAPHEQVTVFTNSLQGRDDDGSSMRLSGNVIIGRNSALGLGNDYHTFAQSYERYQQRYQEQQQRVGAGAANAGAANTGAYLYVDRNNIKLGKHKLIMGTEELSYLKSMLRSPYSIYLGSGSTMQISARALYGQNSEKDSIAADLGNKRGATVPLVFSDLDNRIVASQHGQLLVPVNTTSKDISRIFGSGVHLRAGDVLEVSTENGLFTGKITNTEQLRGRQAFNLTMTGDPREALSELSAPTFDQALRIMGTAVHTYTDASLFNSEPDEVLANNTANTTNDSGMTVANLSDLSSVTANGVVSVLQASQNSTTEVNGVVSGAATGVATEVASNITGVVNNTADSLSGANTTLIAGGTSDALGTGNTLGSGSGAGAGAVVSVNQEVAITDTIAGAEVGTSADIVVGGADIGSVSVGGSGATSTSGSSSGSGGSLASSSSSGLASNNSNNSNASDTQHKEPQIKFNKNRAGYAFLMDALGAVNSESIEKVTRMAILGGALHGVHLVNNTANDAMHSRLGVGVSAALAVNSERAGNVTIADNHQGSALWMMPMYRSYNVNDLSAQGREYGTDLEIFGVVMGLDFTPMSKWRTGVMWNVGDGQADGKDVASGISNDFNFYGLGLYTGVQLTDGLALSADVGYVKVKNKLSVDPQVTNWGTMKSDVSSQSWSFNVGAHYRHRNRNFEVIPHVGLHYNRLDLDSYTVTSNGATIANSESDLMHMWAVPLGVTFACDMEFETWVLRPALDLTVITNLGDTSMDSKTVFDGIKGADFEYTTDVFDRFSYGATVGVSASSAQMSFGINVGYTGSANTSDVLGSAQLRYIF